MRLLVGFAILLHLMLCAVAHGREISARTVERGITRSVVFLVVPTAEGKIGECRLKSVQDLKPDSRPSTFQPSPEFVRTACSRSLANGPNWIPEPDGSGGFKEILEICMWSKAIPDNPICRVEVQAKFAEELPLGAGYSAIFALSANESGHLTSCRFDSLSDLSSDPKPVDFKPHELVVSDACRKLSSVRWKAPSPETEAPREFFMYCRYTSLNPARSFCDRQYGE